MDSYGSYQNGSSMTESQFQKLSQNIRTNTQKIHQNGKTQAVLLPHSKRHVPNRTTFVGSKQARPGSRLAFFAMLITLPFFSELYATDDCPDWNIAGQCPIPATTVSQLILYTFVDSSISITLYVKVGISSLQSLTISKVT